MRALNPFSAEWFSPAGAGETRFKLRGMTGREQAEHMPDIEFTAADVLIPGKTMTAILVACLEDWDKFDGAPDFIKGDEAMIDYLPYTVQAELVGQVMAKSIPSEETKKK